MDSQVNSINVCVTYLPWGQLLEKEQTPEESWSLSPGSSLLSQRQEVGQTFCPDCESQI